MWKVMPRHKKQNGERGDTLVEVLIAIVVVSTVIGGAYVVSNNSLQSTRASQERSNALKLAQGQLEQLKSVIDTTPAAIYGAGVPTSFCIYNGSGTPTLFSTSTSSPNAKCVVDTSGTPTSSQPKYTIEIDRTAVNNFQLSETWTDVSGHFTDSLQFNYRDYQ